MKKIILIATLTGVFILPSLSLSQSNSNSTLEGVLGGILKSQNISQKSEIKCDKVTDEEFEELGEAVMNIMHPDERQHELMDQMMGGEGSESLKTAHILMGENYLGCSNAIGSMMGNWSNYSGSNNLLNNMMGYNMMGNFGALGWFGWIFMVLFWVSVILAIMALIKWLAGSMRGEAKGKSAVDILKERYAKGEISKEEFEEKKKDLI